ncbi:MAG: SDR family oxidoreductase [Thermodesulfobacteriota bacterium]
MKKLGELMDLGGRVALVTGGGGHIGSAIAGVFLEAGARVFLCDRSMEICERRAAELEKRGLGRPDAAAADLASEEEARGAVRHAVRQAGRLDILVHCAAYVGTTKVPGWVEPFEKQSVAAWDAAMRVNLTAAFAMTQEAAPSLKAGGHGSVILVSSIYGMVGPDGALYEGTDMGTPAGYAAGKGGLIQLGRYLATTLAPEVRVNCLTPGGVWRGQPESFRKRYEARTPLRRMATEEDLKGAALFLAGDLSSYVTGHNLVVDGGWTAW